MGWFPDMFWLFLEWSLWLSLALAIGVGLGWMLWRRRWRAEVARSAAETARLGEERAALIERAERAEEAVREREGGVARLRKEHAAVLADRARVLAELQRAEAAVAAQRCPRCASALVPKVGGGTPETGGSPPQQRPVVEVPSEVAANATGDAPADAPPSSIVKLPPRAEPGDEALFDRLSLINEGRSLTKDDLTALAGVNADVAERLNHLGIHSYYQVALLDQPALNVVERRLRMVQDAALENNWSSQAAQLHFEVHDEDIYDQVVVPPVYGDALDRGLAEAARGRRLDYRDDLKLIRGVGPKMEQLLNEHGLVTFWQVARLDADGVAALNSRLSFFPGRIERDEWVAQAAELHARYHGYR